MIKITLDFRRIIPNSSLIFNVPAEDYEFQVNGDIIDTPNFVNMGEIRFTDPKVYSHFELSINGRSIGF